MAHEGIAQRGDIGDTALFLCGYFSESLNRRIIDTRYYQEIGEMAYKRLNYMVPDAYEIESFYNLLSKSFGSLTLMIGLISQEIGQSLEEKQNSEFILFLSDPKKIKVS